MLNVGQNRNMSSLGKVTKLKNLNQFCWLKTKWEQLNEFAKKCLIFLKC